MLVSHLSICHLTRKQEIVYSKKKKESPLKIRFFVLDKCQQKFNLWKGSVLQMPKHQLSVSDLDMTHEIQEYINASVKTKKMFSKSQIKTL